MQLIPALDALTAWEELEAEIAAERDTEPVCSDPAALSFEAYCALVGLEPEAAR